MNQTDANCQQALALTMYMSVRQDMAIICRYSKKSGYVLGHLVSEKEYPIVRAYLGICGIMPTINN